MYMRTNVVNLFHFYTKQRHIIHTNLYLIFLPYRPRRSFCRGRKELPYSCFPGHPAGHCMDLPHSLLNGSPRKDLELSPGVATAVLQWLTLQLSSRGLARHLIPQKSTCPLPHLPSPPKTQFRQAVVLNMACRRPEDGGENYNGKRL